MENKKGKSIDQFTLYKGKEFLPTEVAINLYKNGWQLEDIIEEAGKYKLKIEMREFNEKIKSN